MHKHHGKGDRNVDQMIHSARSGKQNILEGSKAALISKETEIKLTNVDRVSLEEPVADQRLCGLEKDFLNQGDLRERMFTALRRP